MKFRKKPVVIDAMQVPMNDAYAQIMAWGALAAWLQMGGCDFEVAEKAATGAGRGIDIRTLEGTMRAEPMDWIIRGVKGEFYPCKPDIFAATYDPVDEP